MSTKTPARSQEHEDPIAGAAGDWRDLLSPDELAAWEANRDDPKAALRALKLAKQPRQSQREVSGYGFQEDGRDQAWPESKQQPIPALDLTNADGDLAAITTARVHCVYCGKPIREGAPRRTVTLNEGPLLRSVAYCSAKCMAAFPDADGRQYDWQPHLSGLSRRLAALAPRVWELQREGLKQRQIAAKLRQASYDVRQQAVSKILRAIRAAIVVARRNAIRGNGINAVAA